MLIDDSLELLYRLKTLGFNITDRDDWWWPNSGSVESLIGAILTQNSRWESVEISLNNLKRDNLLSLERVANLRDEDIYTHIKPSGFYRNKAKNIILLAQNILSDFEEFEIFRESVSRDWLLAQRGIGYESADSILCYTCYKEAFVIDSYTNRLLRALGYEFDDYMRLQEWMVEGIYDRYSELFPAISRANAYALYHGMIVEYCKVYKRGRDIDIEALFNHKEG